MRMLSLTACLITWLSIPVDLATELALAHVPVRTQTNGCGLEPPTTPGETGRLSLQVGELEREYLLHLPVGYDETISSSLVLAFHGYTGSASGIESYTGLSSLADEEGAIVVYPEATSFISEEGNRISSWNDLACNASPGRRGPTCKSTALQYPFSPSCAGRESTCNWCTCNDDLAFVDALLDELENTLCVAPKRIYATGSSNGGMFVQRLGCSMADRFAAVAPTHGFLAKGFNCRPSEPISLLQIYGNFDQVVPGDGSAASDGYQYVRASAVMRKWAKKKSQGCNRKVVAYPTEHDGFRGLSCNQKPNCSAGTEVVTCSWNAGHVWPAAGGRRFGNELIWTFFDTNPKSSIGLMSQDS